jgi:urate oxidase
MKTYKEYGISIYEDYNDLYNRIREDLKDMNNNDIANIIQELIYTINEGVKEEETINQINDILFNEEEEREGL